MNQQESANTHDIRVNINERTNFFGTTLLNDSTDFWWRLDSGENKDQRFTNRALNRSLGEISFGGRLANDSLGIYQHAHKSMIDANTNIVQRVPEQVRILAEEQRAAGERFSTFQGQIDDLLEDLEGVSNHMATAASLALVHGEVQSNRSASSGGFTQLSALVADVQARMSTLDQNQAAIAGSLAEGSTVEWTPSSDRPFLWLNKCTEPSSGSSG